MGGSPRSQHARQRCALLLVVAGCVGNRSDTGVGPAELLSLDLNAPLRVANDEEIDGFGRIGWVGRLENGTIVAADRLTGELLWFPRDADAFVAAAPGQGPGELDAIQDGMVLSGRSVIIAGSSTISIFGADGVFRRALTTPYPGAFHRLVGSIDDSLLIVMVELVRYLPEGSSVDTANVVTLGLADGYVRHEFRRPNRRSFTIRAGNGRLFWAYNPFYAPPVLATYERSIVWGDGNKNLLFFLDLDGNVLDSLQTPIPGTVLTTADVAQAKQNRYSRKPSDVEARHNWDRIFKEVPLPDTLPRFDKLVIGEEGLFWLHRVGPSASATVEWWGCDPLGAVEKLLVTPTTFDVWQVATDGALGVTVDALDVQHVELVRLLRAVR